MNPGLRDIYAIAPEERASYYDALVPAVFPDRFPENFHLSPLDWHLRPETVHRPDVSYRGERIRPIGTMDVEFVSDEVIAAVRSNQVSLAKNYPCGLKCPGCFSEDTTYADSAHFLDWRGIFRVVDEARAIGLGSLKFLGPGELFQNRNLFDILDAAEERKLPISIFTKGAELGDDELAGYIYGGQGIYTAAQLVERVASYSCVRILLGFNSFDPLRQDSMVGSNRAAGHYQFHEGIFANRGIKDYTAKRNRALVNLVSAGFNAPGGGQRLSLIAAPAQLSQIDELPGMYAWAARRNIPLVIAPTMESGPKALGLMRSDIKRDPDHEKLKQLYLAVYRRALGEGILSLEDIRREGISAYMGTSACNQVANGLYLRLNGKVQMCPGTVQEATVFGSVHERSIVDIWKESFNYKLGRQNNNWCQAKTNGLPPWVQSEVLEELGPEVLSMHGNKARERVYEAIR